VNEVTGRILIRPIFAGTVHIVKEMSVALFVATPELLNFCCGRCFIRTTAVMQFICILQ
jgi:hypothetical protein